MLTADQKPTKEITTEANLAIINTNPEKFCNGGCNLGSSQFDSVSKVQSMKYKHTASTKISSPLFYWEDHDDNFVRF